MTSRFALVSPLLVGLLVGLPACGFFADDSDQTSEDNFTLSDSDSDSASETTGAPPGPPSEGFRVFPKYLLQDIPAIVSIEIDGEPQSCPADTEGEGGYLCDASAAMGPLAQLNVEREGFAPALRTPQIAAALVPLDVHLHVEGGPTGSWSGCQPVGMDTDCTQVCEAEQLGCAPASCATQDPEIPLASAMSFADPECLAPLELLLSACEDPLAPVSEAVALQCCCG